MSQDKDPRPHSKDLRTHRRKEAPGIFFITKGLIPRKPILTSSIIADEIINSFRFSVEQQRIMLAAFMVMPDHWHGLFYVKPPFTLPKLMHGFDTWIGSKSTSLVKEHKTIWQESYYDTRVRSAKQFAYVLHYIERNPVDKGLIANREDWPWSSANPKHQDMLTRPWPWQFEQDLGKY